MTFLDPQASPLSAVPGVAPGDAGLAPIVQNLPQTVKAYQRRYAPAQVAVLRKNFDPEVVNSFLKFERTRIQNGNYPLSVEAAVKALKTAQTNRAATQSPKRDPWDVLGNIAKDAGDLVTSIPKMPTQIAHDIMHAPEALTALSSGDPAKILEAPLIRLVPGAYTAHNLVTGNVSEALSHPVMTALDVAPFAAKFGLGEKLGKIPTGNATLGERFTRATDALGRTMPGQFAKNAWAPSTRGLARTMLTNEGEMLAQANPALRDIHTSNLDAIRQENTRAGIEIDKAFPDPTRHAEVVNAFKTGTLDKLSLNDGELAAVQRAREGFKAVEQYGLDTNHLVQRITDNTPETYTTQQAARIDKLRGRVDRHTALTNIRESILHPENSDIASLNEQVRAQLTRGDLTLGKKKTMAAGFVHALDVAGYDTSTMLSDIAKAKKGTIGSVLDTLPPTLPTDATTRARARTGEPALDSRTRWLEEHRGFTQKGLEAEQRRSGAAESRVLPARWQPIFQELKMDKLKGRIEQRISADDPALPQAINDVHQHLYDGIDPKEMKAIDNEVMTSIQELRRQGVNPEFFHNVSREQARAMSRPTLTGLVPKPSQYGVRLNDWTPTVDSFSVSLNHAGLELAREQMARRSITQIGDTYTTTYADAMNELRPAAERAAARHGTTIGEELERLARKTYVRWSDTEAGFMAGNAKPFKLTEGKFNPEERLIPRHLAKALEQIASPPTYSRMFDPVTKLFRTSVLPFSPRFHLNNIVGGMVSMLMEDPRAIVKTGEGMKIAKEIYDVNAALKRGEVKDLSAATVDVLKSMSPEMRAELNSLGYAYNADNATGASGMFRMKAGGKLAELAQKAGIQRVGNAIDWSYQMNELVDTGYRMAGYLSEQEHALKTGLSTEEAAARGMALADKFMPRWNEMTPMERSVFRVVFPFYAYMSHVFRFAGRYPMDHPWRTAVMSNLARTEINDFGTGLPQALASAFFLGSPDKNGQQNVIDIGAANPFRDFGDNLTIAGFLGQTNPVFKTALRAVGYDTSSRGPNLYPEVDYDPKTGRLVARQPNAPGLVGGLLGDVVPQANLVAALTGTSSRFKGLLRSNPEAANRMLASQLGIPLLWKSVNVPETAFKGELTRQSQQSKVLSRAMKTGDYSQAQRYPGLEATINQLRVLQSQQKLAPYNPGTGSKALTQAESR